MDLIDGTLDDFGENDLRELWDSDYYAEAVKAAGVLSWNNKEALKVASELDWAGMLENGGGGGSASVVLNDRLMTEASLGVISQLSSLGNLGNFSSLGSLSTLLAAHQPEFQPVVKTEHSYSLADRVDPDATLSDLESECFPAIPISEAEGGRVSLSVCNSSPSIDTSTATTTISSRLSISEDSIDVDEKPTIVPSAIITASLGSSKSSSPSTSSSSSSTSPSSSISSSPLSSSSISSSSLSSTSISSISANTSFRKMVEESSLSPLRSESSSPERKVFDIPSISSSSSSTNFNRVLSVPSIKTSMGLVRPSAVVVTQRTGVGVSPASRLGLSSLTLRLPSSSTSSSTTTVCSTSPSSSSSSSENNNSFYMPPTPPSCSGSDSECGSQSPPRTPPLYETLKPQFCNPRKGTARIMVSSRNPINTPLISSQPKGATGAINLTEEEKRTLVSEGYTIPSRLPLTKSEEKSLKKIRRKIKNKISAQESRRKKKEYMDALERKVEKLSSENTDYKRRIDLLQSSNNQLMLEMQRLQGIVEIDEKHRIRSTPIATLLS